MELIITKDTYATIYASLQATKQDLKRQELKFSGDLRKQSIVKQQLKEVQFAIDEIKDYDIIY